MQRRNSDLPSLRKKLLKRQVSSSLLQLRAAQASSCARPQTTAASALRCLTLTLTFLVSKTFLFRMLSFSGPLLVTSLSFFLVCLGVAAFTDDLATNYSPLTANTIVALACFCELQVLLNFLAIRLKSRQDRPEYHLARLGIDSKLRAETEHKYLLVREQYKDDTYVRRYHSYKFCEQCKHWQPLRSVHCKLCGYCSLRNDHHCYITGICLGVESTRYFVVILVYLVAVGLLGIVASLMYVHEDVNALKSQGVYAVVSQIATCVEHFAHCFNKAEAFVFLHQKAMIYAIIVGVFSVASVAGGAFFLAIYCIIKGAAMMELKYLSDVLKFDCDETSLTERLRFLYGSNWGLNFLLPRIWKSTEWTDAFKTTVLLDPLFDKL